MRACKSQQGLTLVETLIALAILGAVAAAVLALISQNTRFSAAAEDRLLARVVLDNLMTEDLGRLAPLERGATGRETELGGRRWIIEKTVVEVTGGLVRIEIKVLDPVGRQTQASAVTLKAERR
ncbi:MAG: type II secretion system minor pseudopilin GspI [Parvularculaceae bacterium]